MHLDDLAPPAQPWPAPEPFNLPVRRPVDIAKIPYLVDVIETEINKTLAHLTEPAHNTIVQRELSRKRSRQASDEDAHNNDDEETLLALAYSIIGDDVASSSPTDTKLLEETMFGIYTTDPNYELTSTNRAAHMVLYSQSMFTSLLPAEIKYQLCKKIIVGGLKVVNEFRSRNYMVQDLMPLVDGRIVFANGHTGPRPTSYLLFTDEKVARCNILTTNFVRVFSDLHGENQIREFDTSGILDTYPATLPAVIGAAYEDVISKRGYIAGEVVVVVKNTQKYRVRIVSKSQVCE